MSVFLTSSLHTKTIERKAQETIRITISARYLVKCNFKGFRYPIICGDSVAVSEKQGILSSHIAKLKHCRSRASIANTKVTVIARGLSTDRACKVRTMTEGKISGTDLKISYYSSYCPDTLKTYQRETKLFEFSPDTNRGEL